MNDTTLMLWALSHGWQATNGKTKREYSGWYWWGCVNGKTVAHRILSDSILPVLDQAMRDILLKQAPKKLKTLRRGLDAEYAMNPIGPASQPAERNEG